MAKLIKSVILLCFFIAIPNTFANQSISWTKQHIPTSGPYLNVFDIAVTKDELGNNYLWADVQYDNTSVGSWWVNVYSSTDAGATWNQCALQSSSDARVANLFGLDKSNVSSATSVATIAYLPTKPGQTTNAGVQHITSPGINCAASNALGTDASNLSAKEFLKTSSSNAYYVIPDGVHGDKIAVYNGVSWLTPVMPDPSRPLAINYIDGAQDSVDATIGKVFIATNNGLYVCEGANYPTCGSAWVGPISGAGSNLNRVLYRYVHVSNFKTTQYATKMLITGGNDGVRIGKYKAYGDVSSPCLTSNPTTDSCTVWSNAIVPKFGGGSAPVITGIAADANYVYVTSYGYPTSSNLTKIQAEKLYSLQNLMASDCRQRAKLMSGLTDGGLTIYTTAWDGTYYQDTPTSTHPKSPYLNSFLSYGISSDSFYSKVALGVSLMLEPDSGIASKIYVPSLGVTCSNGGYSVGTFAVSTAEDNDNQYHAPGYGAHSGEIMCYPSGKWVTSGKLCNAPDIGSVFYVFNSGLHGFVAATEDYMVGGAATEIAWDMFGVIAGAMAEGMGAGKINTDLIVSRVGNTTYPFTYAAKGACADYSIYDGTNTMYADWFLPSAGQGFKQPLGITGELNEIWKNKAIIDGFDSSAIDEHYWSSTEEIFGIDASIAWSQIFSADAEIDGFQYNLNKETMLNVRVRAIRAF